MANNEKTKKEPNSNNPIAKFLNMISGDFTSIKEMNERKKKLFSFILIPSAVLFLLGFVLNLVVKWEVLGYIVLAIGALGLLLFYYINKRMNMIKQKLLNLDCANCHNRVEYDENVKYEIKSLLFQTHSTSVDHEKSTDATVRSGSAYYKSEVSATGTETATVFVTCKCQHCGAEKTFDLSVNTVSLRKSAKVDFVESGAWCIRAEAEIKEEYEKSNYDYDRKKEIEKKIKEYFTDFRINTVVYKADTKK